MKKWWILVAILLFVSGCVGPDSSTLVREDTEETAQIRVTFVRPELAALGSDLQPDGVRVRIFAGEFDADWRWHDSLLSDNIVLDSGTVSKTYVLSPGRYYIEVVSYLTENDHDLALKSGRSDNLYLTAGQTETVKIDLEPFVGNVEGPDEVTPGVPVETHLTIRGPVMATDSTTAILIGTAHWTENQYYAPPWWDRDGDPRPDSLYSHGSTSGWRELFEMRHTFVDQTVPPDERSGYHFPLIPEEAVIGGIVYGQIGAWLKGWDHAGRRLLWFYPNLAAGEELMFAPVVEGSSIDLEIQL